jgi:lipopolysaccharide/colanic/teichoic acid biosynthesis glycosyltransferase
MTRMQHGIKRAFDVVVAFGGLLALAPLLAVAALMVRLSSRGPVLFRQQRVGRYGRLFTCVKFRTMYAAANQGNTVTTAGDSRITPLGRWLRRCKLDELPQLWNVLTGDMSLVGPRPDVPGYADMLQGDARRILDLRPGITGPATLAFRNEEDLLARATDPKKCNDEVIWPEKVRLNLDYIDHWSFWRDIGYIAATLLGKGEAFTTERTEDTEDRQVGQSGREN